MSCPICGANCKCRKRGEGGICCSCHKHKVRKLLLTLEAFDSPEFRRSYEQHEEWLKRTQEKENQKTPLFQEAK